MYIGYTTLEAFLKRVASDQTIYLNLLEERFPGSGGIGLLRCYLLLLTVTGTDSSAYTVHYWRMEIGDILAPGGVPFEPQYQKVKKAGLSAHAALKHWLAALPQPQGVAEGAVIAMPRELKWVAGGTVALTFEQSTGVFVLTAAASRAVDSASPPTLSECSSEAVAATFAG